MLSLGKAHVNTLHHCCDVVLPKVNQITDLGIVIDDQLSFSPHIETVCTEKNSVPHLFLTVFIHAINIY